MSDSDDRLDRICNDLHGEPVPMVTRAEYQRLQAENERLRGNERKAFEAGAAAVRNVLYQHVKRLPGAVDVEQEWQQYRCQDDSDFRAVQTKGSGEYENPAHDPNMDVEAERAAIQAMPDREGNEYREPEGDPDYPEYANISAFMDECFKLAGVTEVYDCDGYTTAELFMLTIRQQLEKGRNHVD